MSTLEGRVLVVDNYDSFTFNLVQYLAELGACAVVVRNDVHAAEQLIAARPQAIVLSPGPGRPEHAGVCVELIGGAADAGIPLLGVCLGHQAVALAYGGRIVNAEVIMHGKCSEIQHDGTGVFTGLATPLRATRYHSLVAEPDSMPRELHVNAWTTDGAVMGIRHLWHPVEGVQFHPESIGTPVGRRLLATFLQRAGCAATAVAS